MNIEYLREYCLSLPAVTEDVKWENDLVFSIGGKMFCAAGLQPPLRFSFKVRDEEFEEISVRGGFKPAPYLARANWVLLMEPSKLHFDEWKQFVRTSYELVRNKLPKKIRTELGV
jgi:predicted DNA-binding protein (MmcQ/YjbR family)